MIIICDPKHIDEVRKSIKEQQEKCFIGWYKGRKIKNLNELNNVIHTKTS